MLLLILLFLGCSNAALGSENRAADTVAPVEPVQERRSAQRTVDLGRAFGGRVAKECWLKPIPELEYDNPCVLRGDFDGDGRPDDAILVVSTAQPKRRGIAMLLSTGKHILLGAGLPIGNGGDDFSWMDAWKIVPKREAKRIIKGISGDSLLVEATGAAGGLIGMVGGRPRWGQWSD